MKGGIQDVGRCEGAGARGGLEGACVAATTLAATNPDSRTPDARTPPPVPWAAGKIVTMFIDKKDQSLIAAAAGDHFAGKLQRAVIARALYKTAEAHGAEEMLKRLPVTRINNIVDRCLGKGDGWTQCEGNSAWWADSMHPLVCDSICTPPPSLRPPQHTPG